MSSADAYAEPARGRTFTAVLLALLILTVIGALLGFVLGKRDIDNVQSKPGVAQSDGSTGGSAQRDLGTLTTCPQFMQESVSHSDTNPSMPIYLLLHVRTDKREVWICQEADGAGLWYQGHDKRNAFYPPETPKEGDNGLLLHQVTNSGGDKYIATSGGTTYTVSRKELVVKGGGQNLDEPVRQSDP